MMAGRSPAGRNGEFAATETSMDGLVTLKRNVHKDERGSFFRLFSQSNLSPLGWPSKIQQVNFSSTARRGTIRGMHVQPGGTPEYKLVTCVRGFVWHAVVDLRNDSETFLSWEAFELSDTNSLSLLIPPGVAHGFQTLSDDVELVYCHSAPYEPESEIGVDPFDEMLGIPWPLAATAISDRDRGHRPLSPSFKGLKP